MSQAANCARIAAELVALGIRHVVVSPGRRCMPLVMAIRRNSGLTIHRHFDERPAGFLALGLAKGSGAPVAVVATSGSAIANWHPAAVEAFEGGIPLIFLSADRPETLISTGANQTTIQPGLLHPHVVSQHDLGVDLIPDEISACFERIGRESRRGPHHINIQLAEPFESPSDSVQVPIRTAPRILVPKLPLLSGRGVIVVGSRLRHDEQVAAVDFAKQLGWPCLLDATAFHLEGIRVRSTPIALDDLSIIQFGADPTTKWLSKTLATHSRVIVCPQVSRWPARAAVIAQPVLDTIAAWAENTHDSKAWELEYSPVSAPDIHGELAVELSKLDSPVFVGNSLAIRAYQNHATGNALLYANRGVSGIDGNVATSVGISKIVGPLVSWIGDMTLLHDVGSLMLLREVPDLRFVVVDDNGGRIFDAVPAPVDGRENLEDYVQPHNSNLRAIVSGFGVKCTEVESVSDCMKALAAHQIVILRIEV